MAALNQTVPIPSGPAIASYDFQEVATGLGYVSYYAVVHDEEALSSVTRLLIDRANFYADTTSSTVSTTTPSTWDWDTSVFNLPRTVKGTVVFQCTMRNNDADVVNVTLTVQLLKVKTDNTTVALTAQKTVDRDGNTAPGTAMGANEKRNVLLFMPITATGANAIIKKGEKIRLEITLDVKDSSDSVSIFHDPLGRDLLSDTNYTTQMRTDIPFKTIQ